jgi:hypothetical protein
MSAVIDRHVDADTGTPECISYEMFKRFTYSKVFDIISDGQYRKALVTGKEHGDRWAMEVQESIGVMQGIVRHTLQQIGDIDNTNSDIVQRICLQVANNSIPPIHIREGWNMCCITGIRVPNCVDMHHTQKQQQRCYVRNTSATTTTASGSGGIRVQDDMSASYLADLIMSYVLPINTGEMMMCPKDSPAPDTDVPASSAGDEPAVEQPCLPRLGNREMLVHPKFAHFFLCVWFIVKFEHVVRSCSRYWVDHEIQSGAATDPESDDYVKHMYKRFISHDEKLLPSLHKFLVHSYSHVTTSLRKYTADRHKHPVIDGRCV